MRQEEFKIHQEKSKMHHEAVQFKMNQEKLKMH